MRSPWTTIEVLTQNLGGDTVVEVAIDYESCEPGVSCVPEKYASSGKLEKQILDGIRVDGRTVTEKEGWGLEVYGASRASRNLTVKSDDVQGRSRVCETIVKSEILPEPGVIESSRTLVKELESLGLTAELVRDPTLQAAG